MIQFNQKLFALLKKNSPKAHAKGLFFGSKLSLKKIFHLHARCRFPALIFFHSSFAALNVI